MHASRWFKVAQAYLNDTAFVAGQYPLVKTYDLIASCAPEDGKDCDLRTENMQQER